MQNNEYMSFDYVGDVKRMIFERQELCYKVEIPNKFIAIDGSPKYKEVVKREALIRLAEMLANVCEVTTTDIYERNALEVRFCVKVLSSNEKKDYESRISDLDGQLRALKKDYVKAINECDRLHKVDSENNLLRHTEEITRKRLNKIMKGSFIDRLKYLFTGNI